ncbi:MAG: molybdenum cofactor guanylyltransferase [Phycisphaerae bacterium]|nr:MAG: molybdenum cofactor guanylyltransferase [Planctomycetota bacterium]KAB2947025.1 MAG: molybdenum cofactor guanylyltransferase [Phycisphaerae bacterium]MBE7456874.1 molybdenum cofactor guanylyltransferase [Planctomycetia bacterium]MCL4717914.1 molybdenum cofactor guanylyltransferase [Phycisphaerae bacterium]MCQ3919869.1 hypothetical protein [Planctomycetota bacterium]
MSSRSGMIVLAGGRSTRMGFSKHRIEFAGATALDRIIRVASQCVDQIVVSVSDRDEARSLQSRLSASIRVVIDSAPGRGPLQGLSDSLKLLGGSVCVSAVVACDYPLVSREMIRLLFNALGSSDAIVPLVGGNHHVLLSVVRVDAFRNVGELLESGRYSVQGAFRSKKTSIVTEETMLRFGIDPAVLATANTPPELEYVRTLASRLNRP